MLPAALAAAFTPTSFFDDFPLGRSWIAHRGDRYNEHLVRDVGALLVALIIVTALTLWRHWPTRPVAAGWLAQGTLHLTYHLGHLAGFDAVDKVGLIGSLATVPALALVALWAGWRTQNAPRE
jgi:hypothetical protein